MFRVSDDGGGGVISIALSGLWGENGEGAAVTEQGSVQQAFRRGGGVGVRERGGATSGATVWGCRAKESG